MKWFLKADELAFNFGEINFNRKVRGRKPANELKGLPKPFTRIHCASLVGEIFDLVGRANPIISVMKLDLHDLTNEKGLSWTDSVPENLLSLIHI